MKSIYLKASLFTAGLGLVLFASYELAEEVYYRGFYTGCLQLAEAPVFDAETQDWNIFRCNYLTKVKMKEWGDIDVILIDNEEWPDRGQ